MLFNRLEKPKSLEDEGAHDDTEPMWPDLDEPLLRQSDRMLDEKGDFYEGY